MMIVVTESLYVGTPEEAAARKDSVFTSAVTDTVHAINEGYTAFIPVEDWETVAEVVLTQLGASPERISDALYFARNGYFMKDSDG